MAMGKGMFFSSAWESLRESASSALVGILGPGTGWLAFNGLLVLLGIGVGAVIPTISTRAIEAARLERASLVSRIVFMCQLAGRRSHARGEHGAFSAVSARDLQRSLARDGIVLAPDQRQAVEEIIAGAGSVHALPLRTAGEFDDLAEIVDRAYQAGLSAFFAQRRACFAFDRPRLAFREAELGASRAGGSACRRIASSVSTPMKGRLRYRSL
jgi:hypothetical protein